jgi:hypothetical protein
MNWTFNQNCQLIIPAPNKGGLHSLEVITDPKGNIIKFNNSDRLIDRTSNLILDIEFDGLYKYYLLLTSSDPNTIDITKIGNPNNSVTWTEEEEIFSICHLRKCVFAYEKQAIEEFLSTCNKKNCNKRSSQQSTRDILLMSIFVLENLIARQRYLEAETILNSLNSCDNLCKDSITKTCCCNG